MLDEQGDVSAAAPQGRDRQAHDVQTIVQVLPKAPLLHRLREVPVCRGDHPEVDRHRLRPSDGDDGALFQDAKQLALERFAHVADLVEQDGSALGGTEESERGVGGAGEGPGLVAEKLALQQGFVDSGAVDADEGATGSLRLSVNRAGDQLFARPGLTLQQ